MPDTIAEFMAATGTFCLGCEEGRDGGVVLGLAGGFFDCGEFEACEDTDPGVLKFAGRGDPPAVLFGDDFGAAEAAGAAVACAFFTGSSRTLLNIFDVSGV